MFQKKPAFEGVVDLPFPPRPLARDIEKSFARLFATDDGKAVLSHLSAVTFMRVAGMDSSDAVLRYQEGQRALLAMILRMIDRGRGG